MQTVQPHRQLAQQIKTIISQYNTFAKANQYRCFDTELLKKQVGLTTQQWDEAKVGSNAVSYDTYQHILGVAKQTLYDFMQNPKKYGKKVVKTQKVDYKSAPRLNKIHGNSALKKTLAQIYQKKQHKYKRIITNIKTQKSHKDRFNVFINHKYAFPVSISVMGQFFLRTGMPISKQKQQKIENADSLSKVVDRGINYQVRTMHTGYQVAQKLRKYTKNTSLIQRAIKKLKHYKIINDKLYTKLFIENKVDNSDQGPRQIQEKLYKKGIDNNLIHQCLQKYTFSKQLHHALKLAKQKYAHYTRYSFRQRVLHVKASLVRKGYNSSVVSKAIELAHFHPDLKLQHELLLNKAQIGKRKYAKWKDKSHYKYQMKVKQYLIRQGFSFDEISQIKI